METKLNGGALKQGRLKLKWTTQFAAKKLGIPPAEYEQIESTDSGYYDLKFKARITATKMAFASVWYVVSQMEKTYDVAKLKGISMDSLQQTAEEKELENYAKTFPRFEKITRERLDNIQQRKTKSTKTVTAIVLVYKKLKKIRRAILNIGLWKKKEPTAKKQTSVN
ncbi:hypothetical protein ACSBL2_06890 [Pedobacter sp. AW31-3R]|uniref:hypothetical protein n=1 Tax=Pedobacter sp. AW31-3R TaxID=3445781 RepID=UPI003FA0D416